MVKKPLKSRLAAEGTEMSWLIIGLVVLLFATNLVLRIVTDAIKNYNSWRENAERKIAEGGFHDPLREPSEDFPEDFPEDPPEALVASICEATRKNCREMWGSITGGSKEDKRRFIGRFAAQCISVGVLLYLLFPRQFSDVVYEGLFLNVFLLLPLALSAIAGIVVLGMFSKGNKPLAIMVGVAMGMGVIGSTILIDVGHKWRTAQRYAFTQVESMPEVHPQGIRYTPFDVAYNDIVQNLNSSEFSIERENMHAVDVDGGIGYVAPITPEGIIGTFFRKQDGFMKFSDAPALSQIERVSRVKQPFAVGQGMLFFDDILRKLYLRDPFCRYPELYYLQLGATKDKFVAVAPKVKYAYEFPCFFVPYWAGVTLVHSDGSVESLSPEEAKEDARLAGKRIYPQTLARSVVEAQTFDQGLLSGLYQRPGLIRIPTLPGGQQMPYLYKTRDGRDLFVVATEPAGNSFAMFRMYMVNAHSGDREVWELDPAKGILGPDRAGERVKSLPNYVWGTTHELLESFPIPKDGKLLWKYTVSTTSRTGVVLTVVVDASTNDIEVFSSRAEFEDWYAGRKHQPVREEGLQKEVDELRKLLKDALERLDRIKP